MNFLHIPGQGLGVLLTRISSKTEIRSFWVRTPKVLFGWHCLDRATNFSNADAKFEVGPLLGDALPDEYEVNITACNKFSGLRTALRRELQIK